MTTPLLIELVWQFKYSFLGETQKQTKQQQTYSCYIKILLQKNNLTDIIWITV